MNTPNLKTISSSTFSVNYTNMNTSNIPTLEIPQSVTSIGNDNNGIYYMVDYSNPILKAKIKGLDNSYWCSVNDLLYSYSSSSGIDITFPENTYGIAGMCGYSTQYSRFSFAKTIIPESVKYISANSIENSEFTSIEFYANPISVASGIYTNASLYALDKVVIGPNVREIPASMFTGMTKFTNGIVFNTPANTDITIGDNAFYYKSARAVNIYYNAPNASITGYDWSGKQNVTPTFIEL